MNSTNNTQNRWQKLKNIFNEAAELDNTERQKYLSKIRFEEKTLYDELADLFELESEADDFWGEPLLFENEDVSYNGEHFGVYKIVGEIGHGGMGVVLEAVRDDGEFDQRVAVKLTNRTHLSAELVRRFRTERQIHATLEHPNIVSLLDGGITKDKIPYFVMEFIEGVPVDEFCRENDFSISERCRLFIQICEAVAYAHRRLIVHRDLKPSNILVTKDGQIKLLDFGIAKLLDDEAEFQTLTENAPLTPGYSSPEQIRGEEISTASDIFSLGIILYQILTDKNPSQIFGAAKNELSTAICQKETMPPSCNISGDSLFAQLSKQQKTDLDNIV